MMCEAWLSFLMRDSSSSVFILVKSIDDMMSCNHAISFYLIINTNRERVWMYQPIKFLRLARWTSTARVRSERGSSRFRGSLGCSGLNMVWMTNKSAFLARYTQHGSSMVMVMMSSMNSYIKASFSLIFTASWSALTSESEACIYSSLGRKFLWGNWRFVTSHGVSSRISSPRSIAASLMVVYYASAGVVPKGRRRQRKYSFSTIAMHDDAICAFVWTRRYTELRSVFPIRIFFEGHLMHMDAIMWSILRR